MFNQALVSLTDWIQWQWQVAESSLPVSNKSNQLDGAQRGNSSRKSGLAQERSIVPQNLLQSQTLCSDIVA